MGTTEYKRCLGCGYILEGLPENRCPECGRSFDPDDDRTYLARQESGRSYFLAAVLGLILMTSSPALLVAAGAAGVGHAPEWVAKCADFAVVSLLCAGFVIEWWVIIRSFYALTVPAHLFVHRRAIWAACLLGLVFFLGIAAAILRAVI